MKYRISLQKVDVLETFFFNNITFILVKGNILDLIHLQFGKILDLVSLMTLLAKLCQTNIARLCN